MIYYFLNLINIVHSFRTKSYYIIIYEILKDKILEESLGWCRVIVYWGWSDSTLDKSHPTRLKAWVQIPSTQTESQQWLCVPATSIRQGQKDSSKFEVYIRETDQPELHSKVLLQQKNRAFQLAYKPVIYLRNCIMGDMELSGHLL